MWSELIAIFIFFAMVILYLYLTMVYCPSYDCLIILFRDFLPLTYDIKIDTQNVKTYFITILTIFFLIGGMFFPYSLTSFMDRSFNKSNYSNIFYLVSVILAIMFILPMFISIISKRKKLSDFSSVSLLINSLFSYAFVLIICFLTFWFIWLLKYKAHII
jgi:hypothetical protein